MKASEVCRECGVPLLVSGNMRWESNGVITLALSPHNRVVFYESDVIDNLFRGLEELIGTSISHIVTESRRRDVRRYIEKLFPQEIEEALQLDPSRRRHMLERRREYNLMVNELGMAYGYGEIKLSSLWDGTEEYPWRTQVIVNPYSMYLYPAEMVGTAEAFEQIDMRVSYREVAQNVYEVVAYPGSHPIELKERLKKKRHPFKPGEIRYDRCPACGVPAEVSRCRWDLEHGTITDSETGRRMAIFAPWVVDSVLEDLAEELGDMVTESVVEAFRRHLREAMSGESWKKDGPTYNRMIASRGLGNLVNFEGDRDYLAVTVENAAMPLLMVGMVQGLFELALNKERSVYEWDLADDGDLTVTVRGVRDAVDSAVPGAGDAGQE